MASSLSGRGVTPFTPAQSWSPALRPAVGWGLTLIFLSSPIARWRPVCLREREPVLYRREGVGERGASGRNRAKSTGEREKIQEWHFIKQAVERAVVTHRLCVGVVLILSVPSS